MYAKVFASIYQGTLRGNSHGLLVFTNLLAHADAKGFVDIHHRVIADEVGLTVEQVRDALLALEAADPESRSPEEDGRRIVRLDEHRSWGWRIVNHAKYRAIKSEEDRREQNRESQQRWRERNQASADVSTHKQDKPKQKQKQKQEKTCSLRERGAGYSDAEFTAFWAAYPRKQAKKDALKAWVAMAPNSALAARLVASVGIQAKSEQWVKDGGQYIPLAATWLRGERWEDGTTEVAEDKAAQQAVEDTARLLAEQRARPKTQAPAHVRELLDRHARAL